MDITTNYLGMTLRSPLVPSASPLCAELDNIKEMEDVGASAVVLQSLFEEQLSRERVELDFHLTHGTESFAEALSYFPEPQEFRLGPEEYLDHIRRAKEAVDIPIIASLNGDSMGGWVGFSKQMAEAGADAIELNIYWIPTDPDVPGEQIEKIHVEVVEAVKANVEIPVAVKINPFFSNMANVAKKLDDAGADALVLFNRFYQPDINIEELEVTPNVLLSTPQAMRVPMRWVAVLYGHVGADLAATGGIHTAVDALKMLMCGANVTMMCSVLLQHGIGRLAAVERELVQWMEKHEYESVQQMQGSMSHLHRPDPSAYERAQYMRALQSYSPPRGR